MPGEKAIQGIDINKGALHRKLGIPAGKTIGYTKLMQLKYSSDTNIAKMARLALDIRRKKVQTEEREEIVPNLEGHRIRGQGGKKGYNIQGYERSRYER